MFINGIVVKVLLTWKVMTAPASTGSLALSPLLLFSAQLYATAELIQYPEPVKGKIALISFFG